MKYEISKKKIKTYESELVTNTTRENIHIKLVVLPVCCPFSSAEYLSSGNF